ncbi:hypothetical protein SADUNF_Sadunf14G0024100 [Salix dunnii]|uniref:F-box domain-containing protein n=1 Tax=Salix dunnii TaxID=1413687 RepID=A0A835JHL5_9ROSI|nr:hypothetical protein SADUNF_Sadunf14G0024100 [Salix dunnii]
MDKEVDRISNLPAHVLDQILSILPIRDAVRTSNLSRKWRYNWSHIPHLVFDYRVFSITSKDETVIKNKLVNIIDHVLLLHNGPVYKFKLSHSKILGCSDIDRWILHLSRGSTEEFILLIWRGQRYKLPSCLFSFGNLIHLKLFNCLLKPPLAFKGFRNLKNLDIQYVTLAQEVFENLISSCPLLERLTLINFDGFTHLKINAPNLQLFDVGGVFDDVSFENNSLLTLVSIGLYKNVKNDWNMSRGSSSKLLSFFVNLPHIRRLEIQSYFIKYLAIGKIPSNLPKPCMDLNYISIRMNFNDFEENSVAFCLLKSCPNLQEIEMLGRLEEQAVVGPLTSFWGDDHWKCLFGQLRLVKIADISGTRSELDFMKFLLSNSPVLEQMTVKPASNEGGLELVKELLRFRRASIQAEVIYMGP